jgi:transposase
METIEHEQGKRRSRRSYTPEFKREIAERCLTRERSIREVTRDFDLGEPAVRRWVAQAEIDAGERPGLKQRGGRGAIFSCGGRTRTSRLRWSCLKRATAFFPKRPGEDGPLHRGRQGIRSQLGSTAVKLFQVSRAAYYELGKGYPLGQGSRKT